jgi:protein TonB
LSPAPNIILDAPPEMEAFAGVPGGVPGGIPGGVEGGIIGGALAGVPSFSAPAPPPPQAAPPPKPPEPPPAPKRVQVSSELQEAKLLAVRRPEYPLGAKMARVQGTVRLRAIIDREGRITDLKVVEGHPLLTPAVLAAVQKWRYSPTILGGEPVEVATEIIVKFRLDQFGG